MKIAGIVFLFATATVALAVPTTYPDKLLLLDSIRGRAFLGGSYETPALQFYTSPQTRSSNGWSVSISNPDASGNAIFTIPVYGTGSGFNGLVTTVSTGGRPATAASFQLYVLNGGGNPIAEAVTIVTNTGESFNLNVPATGQYFGFTTTVPFTSFTVNAIANFECMNDILVGDAADMPSPDNCVGAITVYNGTTNFTNLYSGGDLFGWRVPTTPVFPAGRDVWFRWTAPDSGSLNINTFGSNFDTTLAIYASNSCPNAATVATAFNDDSTNLQSQIITNVIGGQHYFIRVGGFGTVPNFGSGSLNIVFTSACDADFNNDGSIDFFDYLDFVAAFSSGC